MRGKVVGKGNGKAVIIPDKDVVVESQETWKIIYTAGEEGIKTGGKIRMEIPNGFTVPQITYRVEPGYVTAATSREGADLDLSLSKGFRWGKYVYIVVGGKDLIEGDTITVTYGAAFYQARAQYFSQWVEFTVAADTRGNGDTPFSGYSLVANSPRLNVIGSSAVKLVVTVPSIVSINESFPVTVVARDKYDNAADRCNENIKLTLNESPSSQSYSIKLNEGRGELKGVKFNQAGKKRIEASDPLNSLNGKSNPMFVNDKNGSYRIYWGDIHGHTILSDGLGTLEEYYDYGREIADLDFCSTADHDCQISDEDWERTKEINIKYNNPGNFITISGYEFSHNPPGLPYYGDKCIYYPTDDKPLYRSTDITESEWADLKEVGEKLKEEQALMILHQHARGTCSYYEADLVRLVEIYSIHGASEYWGNPLQILSPYVPGPREFRGDSVQDALAKGWRLGIIAGSDCHAGHPGYSDWLRVRKAYHGRNSRRLRKRVNQGSNLEGSLE